MSVDGINASFQTNIAQNASGAHAAEGAKGLFMGHAVQVEASPASILADAAEELGFSVDRTKDYELQQRKQREKGDISQEMIKRYQAMLMQRAGQNEAMDRLVQSLKRTAERGVMANALRQAFPDPADAWAALQSAIDELDADPSVTAEQKAVLKQLADDHFRENAQAIKLGVQGALSGADYPEVGGMESARDLYRSTVGEFSSVNEVFAEIQKAYGNNFDKAMDFLFTAISNDIDSDHPSMEKTHLESVHEKLAMVRLTQSAYTLCGELLDRWANVHNVKMSGMTAMDLLGDIVALRGKNYLGSSSIDAICRKAMPPDIEHEVLFLQELLNTVRKFPVPLFDDENGRMTVMDAVQSAVDQAIEREDEYLASLE